MSFLLPFSFRGNLPFQSTHHLENPWNEGKRVQISRDGQVIVSFLLLQVKLTVIVWECSGSVVECLTQDQGAAGLSLTGVTALCP